MNLPVKHQLFYLFLLLLIPARVFGFYPEIKILSIDDLYFRQLEGDIREYYRATKTLADLPVLKMFQYRTRSGDTLFGIASRVNLPYETIAILNGIESSDGLRENMVLLIPNQAGLFIPLKPLSELETLMYAFRIQSSEIEGYKITIRDHPREGDFVFIPHARFRPEERAYFLGILFRFPLPKGVITSGFGYRSSPFTGRQTFHGGIDISAPEGTEVFSAREGRVIETGWDEIYGNFILILHEGGWQTLYGHLRKIFISLNQEVNSTIIIAEVGSTGLSTGPHLHFEIRKLGRVTDPTLLLPKAF